MIILICEKYEIDGKLELRVSCAYNPDNDFPYTVPWLHPTSLGGQFDMGIGEWVIYG